jgi:hypothetical protein
VKHKPRKFYSNNFHLDSLFRKYARMVFHDSRHMYLRAISLLENSSDPFMGFLRDTGLLSEIKRLYLP